MAKEIPLKLIVGTVSHEKGISEEVIFSALEAALVSATKKKYGADIDVKVTIDPKTGKYETFRQFEVVSDDVPLDKLNCNQKTFSQALKQHDAVKIGDILDEPIESVEFGRIAAQTAKTVICQKVKEAEKLLLAKEYSKKVGQLVIGVVKKVMRELLVIDLGGNAEAILRKDQMLPKEAYRIGDRVRAYLLKVTVDSKGPQILLSRTCNEMLIELFKIEVPEVGEGIIEIKGAARDPGVRAKIAVKTNDGRLDPVGACVGMRGNRVQAVSNELGGERVDVILWDESPAQFVMNAMSPADVVSIVVDDESRIMDIAVTDESLSQAIGKNGQNVKLASELTTWELNVKGAKQVQEETAMQEENFRRLFKADLNIDEAIISGLIEAGFTGLDEVAYVPVQELLQVPGVDEEIAQKLREYARNTLANQEIETEANDISASGLLEVDGISMQLAALLISRGIKNRDELAELAADDLIELIGVNDKQARSIIMSARSHWFS